MKAVILCGGKGQRIGSDMLQMPKALVQVANRPLISYTMERYVAAGITDFVLCGGYMVKALQVYFCQIGSLSAQTRQYSCYRVNLFGIDCIVEIWDTGENSCKADRIRTVLHRIADDTFFISYCDCISDVNICSLLAQHQKTNALMTLTVVNPVSRYGHVICQEDFALEMEEKPLLRDVWINGGFIAVSPEAAGFFAGSGNENDLETAIMPELAQQQKLAVYRHMTFWRNIETQKDIAEMNVFLLG